MHLERKPFGFVPTLIEFIQPAYCALIQTKQTLEKIVKWYLYCTDNSYSVRFFKIKKKIPDVELSYLFCIKLHIGYPNCTDDYYYSFQDRTFNCTYIGDVRIT